MAKDAKIYGDTLQTRELRHSAPCWIENVSGLLKFPTDTWNLSLPKFIPSWPPTASLWKVWMLLGAKKYIKIPECT